MKTLIPETLTAESFKPFGDVLTTVNQESTSINSGNCLRYSNLAALDIDQSGATGISLFDAKPYSSPYQLNYVERHPLGSQAFVPMTNRPFLVVVALESSGTVQEPKAFLTDGTQGVNYHRNTWHGVLTPIGEQALFAVVDYIGEQPNLEEYEFTTPYLIEF